MKKKIGLIGLGTVGESSFCWFMKHRSLIKRRIPGNIEIAKVCDSRKSKKKVATNFGVEFTTEPYQLINDPEIDVIVELIGGINPARKYIIDAINSGKDVVTANKALLADSGDKIFSLAKEKKRRIGFEASVCGAIPILRSISESLVSSRIGKFYGILNGTTNYVLDCMERENLPFLSILRKAKQMGIAERNSRLDIEGVDSLHKLAILSYLCFGRWPQLDQIHIEGISGISLLDIRYARELNYAIKLLAIARKTQDGLDLRVHPVFIKDYHPLATISGTFNAIWLDAHPAGELLFYGKGAGGPATASAVVSDMINVAFGEFRPMPKESKIKLKNIKSLNSRYYIRFMAQDKPGVLSRIAKILAAQQISIASVTQRARGRKRFIPIIMFTHYAQEKNINQAIAKIDKLLDINGPSQIIRIVDL